MQGERGQDRAGADQAADDEEPLAAEPATKAWISPAGASAASRYARMNTPSAASAAVPARE